MRDRVHQAVVGVKEEHFPSASLPASTGYGTMVLMQNMVIYKVRDMKASARAHMQRLIGRQLKEEEAVAVIVHEPGIDSIEPLLDQLAKKAGRVPRSEFNALVEEAMDHVRHH
jgi:hypothetical protein